MRAGFASHFAKSLQLRHHRSRNVLVLWLYALEIIIGCMFQLDIFRYHYLVRWLRHYQRHIGTVLRSIPDLTIMYFARYSGALGTSGLVRRSRVAKGNNLFLLEHPSSTHSIWPSRRLSFLGSYQYRKNFGMGFRVYTLLTFLFYMPKLRERWSISERSLKDGNMDRSVSSLTRNGLLLFANTVAKYVKISH